MELLRRLFSRLPPAKPVLLRLHTAGGPPGSVEVHARWAPSGRVVRRAVTTADGLCLVPWLGDASEVELRLWARDASARVRLDRADTEAGEVIDVELAEGLRA